MLFSVATRIFQVFTPEFPAPRWFHHRPRFCSWKKQPQKRADRLTTATTIPETTTPALATKADQTLPFVISTLALFEPIPSGIQLHKEKLGSSREGRRISK